MAAAAAHPADGAAAAPGYLPALEGLRGIAILLVLIQHHIGLYATFWIDDPALRPGLLLRAAASGWAGVDLFFVLSGFLISGILLDTSGAPGFLRSFYARRVLRIFPLYYGTLALLFGIGALVPALQTDGFREVAERQGWLWLYASNIAASLAGDWIFHRDWIAADHFWSLAVEEQFYLVWPFLIWSLDRRTLGRVAWGLVAVAFLLRLGFTSGGHTQASYTLMPCRMDCFAVGALIALAVRRPGAVAALRPWARAGVLVLGAFLVGLGAWEGMLWMGYASVQTLGFSALALFFGALVVLALAEPTDGRLHRALCRPWLLAFGKYSYALYVFNWVLFPIVFNRVLPVARVMEWVPSPTLAILLRFVPILAVSFGCAWASWHLYEKRFLALKRYFPRAAPAPPVGSLAAR